MITIYLAGPINGCTDAEAHGWRTILKQHLRNDADFTATEEMLSGSADVLILDPMRRDYRGVALTDELRQKLVYDDLADIARSDIIVVNCSRPSWGTAMEIVHAAQMGKTILRFGSQPSPWLDHFGGSECGSLESCFNELAAEILARLRPASPALDRSPRD
jgi:nucleoside 2-deoxyribosyltransferase